MKKPAINTRHAARCRQALAALESRGWPTDAKSLERQDYTEISRGTSTTFWLCDRGDPLAAVVVETMDDPDFDTVYPTDGCMVTSYHDLSTRPGIGGAATRAIKMACRERALSKSETA